ncbi:MAG: hypothetical protein Q7S37_01180 [bacterium]|nr:hypothetical protein [bacterium]
MNKQETKELFINPYYAINISPDLISKHELMVTKEKWIEVNSRLIDELGKEEWLKQLLAVLESKKHDKQ